MQLKVKPLFWIRADGGDVYGQHWAGRLNTGHGMVFYRAYSAGEMAKIDERHARHVLAQVEVVEDEPECLCGACSLQEDPQWSVKLNIDWGRVVTKEMGSEQPSLELCQDEGCPHHGTPHVCVSGIVQAAEGCSVCGVPFKEREREAEERGRVGGMREAADQMCHPTTAEKAFKGPAGTPDWMAATNRAFILVHIKQGPKK